MTGRVVVTGLGAVSGIGIGVEAFCAGLRAGRSSAAPITRFDATGFPSQLAGEVPDFDPYRALETLKPDEWGRTSQLAAAAARLAVQDAGIDPATVGPDRVGSCMGTTAGESQAQEVIVAEVLRSGWTEVAVRSAPLARANRLALAVNQELGFAGEAMTVGTACAAGNYAIGYAYDRVRSGAQEYMIGGGADSINRWSHAGFHRIGAMAEHLCSPFDRDRTGILIGEGGAALLLESLQSARRRGARVYAEVLGYGMNCDARHQVAPDPASIADCMRLAHRNSGIGPGEVDYICAHGTGTPSNDAAEAAAVAEVFGSSPPPIGSIKSMIGHTMGAASAFGAIASALAIAEGFIPPTVNVRTVDPALPPLDLVMGQARETRVNVVQNNGFAFGGNNAILVLRRLP